MSRLAIRLLALLGSCLLAVAGGCGDSGGGSTTRGWVPTDPEAPGPYSVGFYRTTYLTSEYGTFQALIYYPTPPAAGEGTARQPAGGYPAVVVANGYAAPAILMDWISNHLASHGYLVLAFTPANPLGLDVTSWAQGFRDGLSKLFEENGLASSPVFGKLSAEKAGIVGLSMGGAGALEAAGTDARVDAVVALAPGINDMGMFLFQQTLEAARTIEVPVQIQVGSRDCLVNPPEGSLFGFTNLTGKGVKTYYEAISSKKQYVEIAGGNHIGFISAWGAGVADEIMLNVFPIDCPPEITPAEQNRIGAKYATLWLDTFVYGTDAWKDALFARGIEADLAGGVLSDFENE